MSVPMIWSFPVRSCSPCILYGESLIDCMYVCVVVRLEGFHAKTFKNGGCIKEVRGPWKFVELCSSLF